MPVATAAAKGLMSADDKKHAPQYVNIGKGSARKLFDFTASYQQYVLALFVIVGLKPAHLILYGRSEATVSDIRLYFDKIRVESSSLKFYRKNDSIYISNESPSDPCNGTALSVFPIGNEAVTIDETFTEIPIE